MNRSLASKIKAANSALIAEGNLDAVGEFFTPDYVTHVTDQDGLGSRWDPKSPRYVSAGLRIFRSKSRFSWRGRIELPGKGRSGAPTRGDFKGFPPSGRSIVWRDMVTSQFRDGLITEDWFITDLAERLLLARKR